MTPTLTKGANLPLPTGRLELAVGWDERPGAPDIDAAALLLTAAGRVRDDADFVFYNQPVGAGGAVRHAGKARVSGSRHDTLVVDLAALPAVVDRVAVTASADGGTFAAVLGLHVVVRDAAAGADVCRYDVTGSTTEKAMLLGECYRRAGAWKFRAVGQGWDTGLAGLATDFGVTVDDAPATPSPAHTPTPPPAAARPPAAGARPPAATPPPPRGPQIDLSKRQKLIDMEKRVERQAPAMLSLVKTAGVSLEKRGLGEHTAKVALCLDISASMHALYQAGTIQKLAERVLALGLRFDDDGEVDVFLFGKQGHEAGGLQLGNHATYVPELLREYRLEGGTDYGAAMRLIRQHYFGDDRPRTAPLRQSLPVYVMFVTDGETGNKRSAREQVISSSYEPLFWQFMAVGGPGHGRAPASSGFGFLRQLDDLEGRFLDNANFFSVGDPAALSDSELFELMMAEYPGWLPQARSRGLLG